MRSKSKFNENTFIGAVIGFGVTVVLFAVGHLFSIHTSNPSDPLARHGKVLETIRFGSCVRVVDGFYRGATGLVEAPPNYGTISIQVTQFNDYADKDLSYNNWVIDVWAGYLEIVPCEK